MYAKFHCPASAVTLLSKDGEGEIHPSLDIESQKSPANSVGTIVENNLLFVTPRLDAHRTLGIFK